MSLETINMTLGRFMGPFLAGLLIELTDFSGTYIVLMLVYIVAFVLILVMKGRGPVRAPSPYAFWNTVSRGFKYSVNNSVIRSVLVITLIMNAMAFSVESLFPVVAKNHLGVGAGLTGILISAQAIGSLAAASVIASLAVVRYHGRIFALGLVLQLISLLFFALSPWYPVSFLMLMLAGLGAAGYSTMQSTIILISSEPEMRGTALGMLGQCIGVAAVGGLAVGVVANYFSAQAAVAMSVSLGLLLLIPALSFSPLLRRPISPPGEAA
jgi:predicted MFS family arabinose efflux permease